MAPMVDVCVGTHCKHLTQIRDGCHGLVYRDLAGVPTGEHVGGRRDTEDCVEVHAAIQQ